MIFLKKFLKTFSFIFLLLFFVKFAFMDHNVRFQRFVNKFEHNTFAKDIKNENISDNKINSTSAIAININTKEVVYSKNPEDKIYPASLTKIMTTILGVENTDNINKQIVIPGSVLNNSYSASASMAGFRGNDNVQFKDLLYGAMLPSGADATSLIAYFVSGSEDEFANLMNEKAEELNMNNTHFDNASGLHSNNNYTTVSDLSKLLLYSLDDGDFKAIFTSSKHKTFNGLNFESTFSKTIKSHNISNNYILGAKTGYTGEAGLCLASYGEKNGNEYIVITANAKGDHYSKQNHILDTNYIFENL